MQINKLIGWLHKQKKINKLKIKKKNINHLKDWIFKKNLILHKTNNFFSIKPFLFERKNKKIFQPLIIQKEEGILGIIKQKKKGKDFYLLQSKIEPGNINGVQFSPTVQATKSNYQRVHKGKKIPYLNIFRDNKIKFISQSEQGYRYLSKFNKNAIVVIEKKNKNFKKLFLV